MGEIQSVVLTSTFALNNRFVYIRWHHWVEPTIYQVPVSFVVPIHLGIFVFGCLYEVLLSYDAIRYKNNILLSALCICDVCNFVFAAMHFGQMRGIIRRLYHDAHDVRVNPLVKSGEDIWPQAGPALLVIPFIVGVCSSVMWALASKLHRDFAWAIYKHIHADSDVKSRYLTYQVEKPSLPSSRDVLTYQIDTGLPCVYQARSLLLPRLRRAVQSDRRAFRRARVLSDDGPDPSHPDRIGPSGALRET